jgi:hypothetical protein
MRCHSFLVVAKTIAIAMLALSLGGASVGHFFGMDLSTKKEGVPDGASSQHLRCNLALQVLRRKQFRK